MKSIISMTLMALLCPIFSWGQPLTQTIRGTLLDTDSKTPLIGATVLIPNTNPPIGTITDLEGNFRLENVATGRITLLLSYMGYETTTVPNVVVNSGKEVFLNLSMQESAVKMDELVVTANINKGEAINDMAMISARSVSAEETSRFAGGFNDPSRILSNFAGVTSTQDGSNDIIVRGNSPKYVQWRLEGIEITNPNHFGDQSAVGGAVSALNNNLLATSDFYTGAFSPEYGDVLSGVYDVRLRTGNNEKVESVFGFGLLGTDFTLEGPLKKGYGGSYLVNYRYSTVALISNMGLVDVPGIPKFQDAAFKVVLPTNKLGTFSLFSLGGKSEVLFEDVDPTIWETPGNRFMNAEISEDYGKESHLLNSGLNHTLTINKNSFVSTTLCYSSEGISDNVYESGLVNFYDDKGAFLRDSVINRTQNFKGRLNKSAYRSAITYHNKFNAKNKIQIGTKYTVFTYDVKQSQFADSAVNRQTLVDFNENIGTLRNFISWKYRVNEDLTLVTGLHNMNVLFNNKSTLEPRFSINWNISSNAILSAGYGKHSNMESVHNYFAKVKQPDGSLVETNRDLGLLKANHYVIGFEQRIGRNLRAKVEAYYQDLYNLPVENIDTSYYSTINEGLEFRYVDLVNKGTGKNYGIEFTLERFFNNNYYYMINGSIYESKYTALDGIERNTQYNGHFLINVLFGKEYLNLGKKHNQTLGINGKIFAGGGKNIIPLMRDEQGKVSVNPEKNQYWDYSKAYNRPIENVYQVTLSASYKWNKPKATHEIFLTLNNLTNFQAKLSEFYDERQPNSIGYVKQFGFFPNLMYRVYF